MKCHFINCKKDGFHKFDANTGQKVTLPNGTKVGVKFEGVLCDEHYRLMQTEAGSRHCSVESRIIPVPHDSEKFPSIEDVVTRIGNDVYAVLFEALSRYERRGYNAHQRAQSICEEVKQECRGWLAMQKSDDLVDDRPEYYK